MNNNQSLVRLSYASFKDKYVDGKELQKILAHAQAHNTSKDITGVLVFNSQFFLQAIEGSRVEISKLYNKIATDPRHHDVQIIRHDAIERRIWTDWAMEFISISEAEEQIYRRYTGQKMFNPFSIATDDIDMFLTDITCSFDSVNHL